MRLVVGGLIVVGAIVMVVLLLTNHQSPSEKQTASKTSATSSSQAKQTKQSGSKSTSTNKGGQSQSTTVTNACTNIFTLDDADMLLGQGASASHIAAANQTDTTITTCSYVKGAKSVTIVAHVHKTRLGENNNDVEFGSGRPRTAVAESGYGSAAFWDSNAETFNVLQNNDWYAIGGGSLSNDEQAARLLLTHVY